MHHIVIPVLSAALAALLCASAFAAGSRTPSAVTGKARPPTTIPFPSCLGASVSLLCVDDPRAYTPRSMTSPPISTSIFGAGPSDVRTRLESRFDAGFFSRRRRQERCLQARPDRPPQAYRQERISGWITHVQASRERPFFDAMQRLQPGQRPALEDAYSAYLYCVTHDGF